MKKLAIVIGIMIFLSFSSIIKPSNAQVTATVSVEPAELQLSTAKIGEAIKINITISNAQNVWAWSIGELSFDQDILRLEDVQEGAFLQAGGETFFLSKKSNQSFACALSKSTAVNGSGVFATATFTVLSEGNSWIELNDVEVVGPPSSSNENVAPENGVPQSIDSITKNGYVAVSNSTVPEFPVSFMLVLVILLSAISAVVIKYRKISLHT
jgi:hypothetical protein